MLKIRTSKAFSMPTKCFSSTCCFAKMRTNFSSHSP